MSDFLKAGEKAQKVYANSEAAFLLLRSSLRLLEEKERRTQEKKRLFLKRSETSKALLETTMPA